MAKYKFIELSETRHTLDLLLPNGKLKKLPLKLRPETPGSELWIRMTNGEEFRECYPSYLHYIANEMGEGERYHVVHHVSDPIFATSAKYSEIRDAIIEHYIKENRWHVITTLLDIKPSESKKLSLYKVVFLVQEHLGEIITFDTDTKEVIYDKIVLKSEEEYKKMDLKQLIEECRLHDLKYVGSKKDLLRYLEEKRNVGKNIEQNENPIKNGDKDIPLKKSMNAYKKMNLQELVEECKTLGIDEKGTEGDLLSRIIAAVFS